MMAILQKQHGWDEDAANGESHGGDGYGAQGEVFYGEEVERHEGFGVAFGCGGLESDEDDGKRQPHDKNGPNPNGPPQVGTLLDGEHNAAHGDNGHDDAEEIQAAGQPRQVRHHEPHHDDGHDTEWHIDKEDPFPANGAHNNPAEDGAGE